MPEQVQQTTVNTFIRGLITEASPLTYPENASVDELNMVLEKTGVRRRRPGIEYEDSHSLSSFTVAQGELTHTETWTNVANVSGIEFLVFQHGETLHFYDKSSSPISAGEKSFSVDLNDFSASNGEFVENNRVDTASIDGKLIVVSNAIEPFSIEFDPDTDTISTEQIEPKVRDFEWQGDTTEYFKPSTGTFSEERKYDTINAGWTEFALFTATPGYVQFNDALPPLSLPWWVATNPTDPSDNDRIFHEPFFRKMDKGTTLVGNGRIILDLFRKNRTAAANDLDTGLTVSLETEIDDTRFTTVTTFAGRVWFSGLSSKKNGSKIYFSRVVQSSEDIGKFYQIGDPTSQQDPDLVDSDGGVISISGAANIRALFTFGDKVLVFAENGVWEIGGVDSVFKATEFFVRRINGADGLFNRNTLVNAEGIPLWWGNNGIFTISQEEVSGLGSGRNISETTIQTFWENIGREEKSRAVGVFDETQKQVFWLYESSDFPGYKYNNVLILDLDLGAFYPWKFEDQTSSTNYVVGAAHFTGLGSVETDTNVVAGGDNVVAGADNVISGLSRESVDGPTEVRFIARDGDTRKITFAEVSSPTFTDWGEADYLSFAETIYYFDGDLTTRKNNIYVTTYFNLTESGFIGEEADDNTAPTAVDDEYTVDKNTTLVINAPGVMVNDSDPEDDPLTAIIDTGPTNGVLSFNSDGSFNYEPDTDFVGEDTFTYHVNDGESDSNIATVTITVEDVVIAQDDIKIGVTRVPIRTTEGFQQITIPNFGVPKAARFFLAGVTEDETPPTRENLRGSIGATDGTTSYHIHGYTSTGEDDSNSQRFNDASLNFIGQLKDEVFVTQRDVLLEFTNWVTDGVVIDVVKNDSNRAYLLTVVFYGGDDLTADVSGKFSLASDGNTVTETVDFEANVLIVDSPNNTLDFAHAPNSALDTGYASFDGTTILQCCASYFGATNAVPTQTLGKVRDDAVMVSVGLDSGVVVENGHLQVENITSTSFDLKTVGDLSGKEVGILALNLGTNGKAWAGVLDTPTSTGNHTFTDPDIEPIYSEMRMSMIPSVNTNLDDGEAGGFGNSIIGEFENVREFCYSYTDEDGILDDTVVAQTLADSKAVNLADHTKVTRFTGSFSSWETNGLTINFDNVDGTVRKWPALFISKG